MEATRERDLHKSLKLLLKEREKSLPPFIDLGLKSSNLENVQESLFQLTIGEWRETW